MIKEKVSVIIPTYNREKTILRAVKSVLDQTYTNIEVLVIDDGSIDGTADVMKNIEDKRVKYIVLEENGGASKARNVGVQLAEGEWVAFQDSDDCWHRNKLEKQLAYAEEHPEYNMIYCKYNAILNSGEWIQVPQERDKSMLEGDMFKLLLQKNVIGAPSLIVKRNVFMERGGFDISYKALEDWEFIIRFAQAYTIGFISEPLLDCYISDSGVSSNKGAYYEARCKMLGQYKNVMIQEGVLEEVMQDILIRAKGSGVENAVKKMMMMYLCQ